MQEEQLSNIASSHHLPLGKLLITFGLAVLSMLPARIELPFLGLSEHASWTAVFGFGLSGYTYTHGSVGALGMRPIICAFVLVQLATAMIPKLLSLRTNERRAEFERIVRCVAMLLAAIQAFSAIHYLESLHARGESIVTVHGFEKWMLLGGTLVAGACLPIIFADLIERFGVGSGYGILLSAEALANARPFIVEYQERLIDGTEFHLLLGLIVLVGLAVYTLTKKGPFRLPTSGLHPVQFTAAAAAVLLTTGTLAPLAGVFTYKHLSPRSIVVRAVAAVIVCVLFSVLHNFNVSSERRRALPNAMALSAVGLVLFGIYSGFEPTLDLLGLVVLIAVTLDLFAELKFRARNARTIALCDLQRPEAADDLARTLAARGIDCAPQGIHLRTLLQFFGPFVPVRILVCADQAGAAWESLSEAHTE